MKKKIALVFGITGQDGSYLADLLISKKYEDIYVADDSNMPIDIQVLINDGEIGLAMLRIIEIIGEDELKNLGSETLYFLVNALNQMDIDLIRNEILSTILPVKV